MKKRIFILTGLLTSILLSGKNMTVYAQQSYIISATIDNATLYSANYKWIYKTENNKTYRRLYDISHQRWVGDWELVP
ncbi:MAG: hypothetical protein NC318_08775 [Blautia sp.]|nr:hypothetical protein [Blautia sp.]